MLSKVLTIGTIILLIVGMISTYGQESKFIFLTIITVGLIGVSLYYCPREISADENTLRIRRVLSGDKVFPYSEISGIELCYPSLGGLRLCGSGGFMGYWGYFHDITIGTFFGYYGDRNECFVIRLKNGRQYVISCCDQGQMVRFVEAKLS